MMSPTSLFVVTCVLVVNVWALTVPMSNINNWGGGKFEATFNFPISEYTDGWEAVLAFSQPVTGLTVSLQTQFSSFEIFIIKSPETTQINFKKSNTYGTKITPCTFINWYLPIRFPCNAMNALHVHIQ